MLGVQKPEVRILNIPKIIQEVDRELEIYPQAADLLPEITSVGRGLFYQAALGGPRPDDLQHVYEICFIDQGSAEWWIDGALHEVDAGHLFINRPGEWHGGHNAILHPCTIYWLQICLDAEVLLPQMEVALSEKIKQDFKQLPLRFFPAGPEIRRSFETLLREYRRPERYSSGSARAALHQLLIETLRAGNRFAQARQVPYSPAVREIVNWIEHNLAEPAPVEKLAAIGGVSVGYLHRLFLKEIGYPPNEYRLRRRVVHAKHALRAGERSITEIAHATGFSSSQYFATVFKRLAGVSPSQYQAAVQEQ